jgi:hypothetical protein
MIKLSKEPPMPFLRHSLLTLGIVGSLVFVWPAGWALDND